MTESFRAFVGTKSYITDPALEAAVNAAVALERPLLVKGEPGTGKTLLAAAVAEAMGHPLIHWPVKSTTRAQDGLYVYDTVQRLYDARFGDAGPDGVKDIRRYIKRGPLGPVIESAVARDPRQRYANAHALETAAAFWHLVDLLWLVLFPLVYVMR